MKRAIRRAGINDLKAALCGGTESVGHVAARANQWARAYGLKRRADNLNSSLSLESWDAEDVQQLLADMDGFPESMSRSDSGPDVDGLPIIVVRFGEVYGLVEGRCRAARRIWRDWRHAVLVLSA